MLAAGEFRGRFSGHDPEEKSPLIIVGGNPHLVVHVAHPALRLSIGIAGFPTHGVGNARRRHQITFIGGIDENLCLIAGSSAHPQLRDADACLLHLLEKLFVAHWHVRLLQHLEKYLLGDVRMPDAGTFRVFGSGSAPPGCFDRELVTQTTKGRAVHVLAFVSVQAAGTQPANMPGLLQKHHRGTFSGRSNRRRDPTRSSTINDDIRSRCFWRFRFLRVQCMVE